MQCSSGSSSCASCLRCNADTRPFSPAGSATCSIRVELRTLLALAVAGLLLLLWDIVGGILFAREEGKRRHEAAHVASAAVVAYVLVFCVVLALAANYVWLRRYAHRHFAPAEWGQSLKRLDAFDSKEEALCTEDSGEFTRSRSGERDVEPFTGLEMGPVSPKGYDGPPDTPSLSYAGPRTCSRTSYAGPSSGPTSPISTEPGIRASYPGHGAVASSVAQTDAYEREKRLIIDGEAGYEREKRAILRSPGVAEGSRSRGALRASGGSTTLDGGGHRSEKSKIRDGDFGIYNSST